MTLKVSGLVRRHAGNPEPTLKGLSFDLPQGTLTALLGRSGAGKSTLLRCVMGLESFEAGTVEIDGVVVQGTAEVSAARRAEQLHAARARLGLVFQSFELFPHLTALENCTLAPVRVKGLSQPSARERATALLCQLGLEARLEAYPAQLSGGQRQRVAIARALAMEPRVLLYDEPTSALDPSMKHEVLQALQRVDATGVTQVVVTHDLALARAVEHVCVLDHGVVIEAGKPAEVLEAPVHEATRALLKDWR
ncbi:MAG: amino acid ABC transporter ATP-binding protein [Myxococcaceae bacterium]|jgi:ABC-type polar amino acid transport system ATPase subunit|nr:amino acid ABC transporter ATP-binding protein [Myxococcaceae bacterium]